MDQLGLLLRQAEVNTFKTQATKLLADAQHALANLSAYGGAAAYLGTGTYSWSDIDIVADGSNFPRLTNGQCNIFNQFFSSSQLLLKSTLAAEMAKILPVPAGGFGFQTSNIVCRPQYPLQTRDDQHALFALEVAVTGLYVYFANGASYVTYNNGAVTTGNKQLSETSAALSQARVRAAVQLVMRRVTLNTLQAHYRMLNLRS